MEMYFKCSECGEEVSGSAKMCPHCGFSFETEEVVKEKDLKDYEAGIEKTIDVIKSSAILFVIIMVIYMLVSLMFLISATSNSTDGSFLIVILLFIGGGFVLTYFVYYFILWKANILEVLYKISKK